MPAKRSDKKTGSTSTSATTPDTTPDATPKPPRTAWKTGEQLEYMLSHWVAFLTHQNEGSLDRFWPRVYEGWYAKWPITPTPKSIAQAGSHSNAILTFRSENNGRIRTWFHNHARPSSKAVKSDLRLNQNEKRKVAIVQAYCSYAWDSGLRKVVMEKWEELKGSHMSTDEDDPAAGSIETLGPDSHIPIDFKLKIAKEAYEELTTEQKKQVTDRCDEEWKKLYRGIPEITDVEERRNKLLLHQQNQPSVAKSLLRVLKNLEDQAGCVAQLFVGYIDPATGKTSCQSHCQGKTVTGLDFHAFCGEEWDEVVEKRFKDWALSIFGDKGTDRRSLYMLSGAPLNNGGSTPSASTSHAPHTAAVEQLTERPSGADTDVVGENEVTEESTIVPLSQVFETMETVPPQTPTPPPPVDQPSAIAFQSFGGNSMPQQVFEPPQFVVPREIFPAPRPVEPVNGYSANVPPVVAEPTPTIVEPSQPVAPSQVVVSPVVHESTRLAVPPVPQPSQTVLPMKTAISPVVRKSASFVAPPVLESSKTLAPEQSMTSVVSPSPVLGSSQMVTINQAPISPIVHKSAPLVNPSDVLGSSQAVAPRQVDISQKSASECQVAGPPHPRPTAANGSSHLPEGIATGDNPGVTTKGAYKVQGKARTTVVSRTRRDSIEGAPEVMLSLRGSGYELIDSLSQREPFTGSPPPSTTPSSATPSSTPSPDDLIVPSSQQSIEGYLTIPMETETDIPTAASVDEPIIRLSQQLREGSLAVSTAVETTGTAPGRFLFAPRVIPTYNIERSDLPSWLLDRGRLDYVLSVEAGAIWEKLIITWLRQERRLSFGLNDKLGASLSLKLKPSALKDYFKWHHNPSKGDSVVLPAFSDETSAWWSNIQPEWRYRDEDPSGGQKDYSYILAGGKKGVFLLILCLAWWDQAHGRNLEKEKVRRREASTAAGMDETAAIDFSDLREHEPRWFNIVNDLIFVMELAQGWPIPGESAPGTVGVAPSRKKRAAEKSDSTSPRKKKKKSS